MSESPLIDIDLCEMDFQDEDSDSLGDLREIETLDEEEVELATIFNDLVSLRDIMLEYNLITAYQGEQLKIIDNNVTIAEDNTDQGAKELETAGYTNHKGYIRAVAMIGGGGLGTAGFYIHPILGLGTMIIGSGLGWIATRNRF